MAEIDIFVPGSGGGGGTVTANQGTPNSLANGWPVEITDGTNVLGTIAHPLATTATVVPPSGVIDANNSSTATLTSGSTFTGTGTSVLPYAAVLVLIDSDQGSATNGATIQFSADNVNWVDASTFTYIVGAGINEGQIFGAIARAQFFRVVYTNGGVNQTRFQLQTVLMPYTISGDMVPISQLPNFSNHAQLVKSSIVGLTTAGGGAYVDVKVNPSGTLTVDASNSTGLVLGTSAVTVGDVGTAPASINVGQTTSNTAQVQLHAGSIHVTNGVLVQGLSTNTASVFLGATGVTTATGFELQAGQATPFSCSDINLLYVIGSNNTDKVCWNVL
jgi:hypothetical protein